MKGKRTYFINNLHKCITNIINFKEIFLNNTRNKIEIFFSFIPKLQQNFFPEIFYINLIKVYYKIKKIKELQFNVDNITLRN